MWHLFQSELLRFRNIAAAFAIGNTLLLVGLSQGFDLFANDAAKRSIGLLLAATAGLALGLYQLLSYRRLNRWTYLIHRPLRAGQIFAAVAGAGAALLLVTFIAPLLVVTVATDLFTAGLVDSRQYLLGLYLYGILTAFYLVGVVIALSASRAAFLVIVLPSLFLTQEAPGLWVFVPQLVVVAWLAYLARCAFKPDLGTHLERPGAVIAAAVPVQYAVLWLLVGALALTWSLGTIFREHGITGLSTFAWDDYFEEGTLPHVIYLGDDAVLPHGLRVATTGRARELLAQIALADTFAFPGPAVARFAQRHQLMFQDRYHMLDEHQGPIRWTFSHDAMMFQGRAARTGEPVAWLGQRGRVDLGRDLSQVAAPDRFDQVPYALANRWLMTERRLYEVDALRTLVHLRMELPTGERWTTPPVAHRSFVVAASTAALYFFEARDLERDPGLATPTAVVPLPGSSAASSDDSYSNGANSDAASSDNIARIHIAELIDSYLVSFVMGSQSDRGYHPAEQVVVEVGLQGESTVVARRPLGQGVPAWQLHRGFIVSPVLRTAHDVVWSWIGPRREQRVTLGQIVRHPPPGNVLLLAALASLLSAVVAHAVGGRRGLSRRARWSWTAGTLLVGVPGLVSLLFLTAREEALDLAAIPEPTMTTPRAQPVEPRRQSA